MGAIVVGLRPGDHEDLNQIAELVGRPPKEVAGILLEQAIRRERGGPLADQENDSSAELIASSPDPRSAA